MTLEFCILEACYGMLLRMCYDLLMRCICSRELEVHSAHIVQYNDIFDDMYYSRRGIQFLQTR